MGVHQLRIKMLVFEMWLVGLEFAYVLVGAHDRTFSILET